METVLRDLLKERAEWSSRRHSHCMFWTRFCKWVAAFGLLYLVFYHYQFLVQIAGF